MVGYIFFAIFLNIFWTPSPFWYEVRGQRSEVISPKRRGGGEVVGVRYRSSGVCFWIDFDSSEVV